MKNGPGKIDSQKKYPLKTDTPNQKNYYYEKINYSIVLLIAYLNYFVGTERVGPLFYYIF